jgi:hypothetical protein
MPEGQLHAPLPHWHTASVVSIQSKPISSVNRVKPFGVGLDLGPRPKRSFGFPSVRQARTKVRPYIQLLRNSFVVARRVSGGSAGGPCAHAQGYESRRFFPSGAKTSLRSGLHRYG